MSKQSKKKSSEGWEERFDKEFDIGLDWLNQEVKAFFNAELRRQAEEVGEFLKSNRRNLVEDMLGLYHAIFLSPNPEQHGIYWDGNTTERD